MTTSPEREFVRRAWPLAIPAVVIAVVAGGLLSGWFAAASAVIGVGLVFANLTAQGFSMSWAARISPTALFAVGLGGFAVRLGLIFLIMLGLDSFEWFSPLAFGAAVVPCTIVLLIFEMRMLSGRMQVDQWRFGEPAS